MLLKLLPNITREFLLAPNFSRTPEPEMLMEDNGGVAAYDEEGKNGALLGFYCYHLTQMCSIIKPGDTVIDLGCGPCNLLCSLAELNPDSQFIGIDLSEEMLSIAERNIAQRNIHNIRLLRQDVTNIHELISGSIDVAVSSMAMHQLPTKGMLAQLFSEVNRLLKDEKRFYLYDLGKMRRTETIEFFLSAVTNAVVREDYNNSLKAAFDCSDFDRLAKLFLGDNTTYFYTRFVPIIVGVKSKSHALSPQQKTQLSSMIAGLGKQQQKDFKMLKLLLRMGGLKSPL